MKHDNWKHTDQPASYETATGPVEYRMTNDYIFRAILQRSRKVLTGLICAVLRLGPEEVRTVTVTNPIELGAASDMKEFILDVHVLLNGNRSINLEMQVQNLLNWQDRSLSYLCRTFDQLQRGQDYSEAGQVVHIGFLNFSPGWNPPEFYATYQLLNIRNQAVYSDKFTLSVVDLTQIGLATEEDKAWQLDYWAKLFTADTWEEIQMIAKNSEYLADASQLLYEMNTDDIERQKCRAREDYYRLQNRMEKEKERLVRENERLTESNEQLTESNEQLTESNEHLKAENEELRELRESFDAREKSLVEEIEQLKKRLEQGGAGI